MERTDPDRWRSDPMPCPDCGAPNTGHLEAPGNSGGAPKPGDVSVCAYCACVAVYGATGMEPAPPDVLADPDVQKAVRLVRQHLQMRKAKLS